MIDAGKKPFVILVVGVNGSGKTTTIGKLGAEFAERAKVTLASGDASAPRRSSGSGELGAPRRPPTGSRANRRRCREPGL